MCLKKYIAVSLLLWLFSQPSFSDVTLSEEEYQAVTQALTTSKTAIENQAKLISSLESELKLLKELQQISSQIITQQGQALSQHSTFLKEQKKEQTVKNIRAFIYGAAAVATLAYIKDDR